MSNTIEELNGMLWFKDKEFKRIEAKLALREKEIKDLKNKNDELNNELKKCQHENKIEKERYSQLRATFKNADIKNKKLMEINSQKAKVDIILEMLNGYEELGMALNYTEALIGGIKSANNKLKQSFESVGLEEILTDGKFDPYMHEPVAIESRADMDDNTIIEEISKGYTLNGDIIKKSKVTICKKE